MAQSDWQILAATFVSGACSLLVEIAGVRVLAPYIGATIYSWAAGISLVLASLSFGYYLGGVLADRYDSKGHLSLILLAAGLMTLLIPLMGALLLPITLALDLLPASLLGAIILVPSSCFYGMVSPFAIKLTSRSGSEGKGAGRVFSLSTIGSILGALGTGFVLIPNVALTHIFILAALLMLFSSILVSGFRKGAIIDVLSFAIVAFLVSDAPILPSFGEKTIFSGDSAYYHIQVVESEWGGSPARILYLDNAPSSAERADGSPALSYALASRLAYSIVPEPRNALVIGTAAGTEVEDLKRLYPSLHVTGVDIDPVAVDLGRRYFSLNDDNRTTIAIDDARRFLLRTNDTYDLVLLDTFRGLSVPYHLTTQEYLFTLKGRLEPGGVVVTNIISSLEGNGSTLFRSLFSTFSSAFENVIVIPVGGDPARRQNIVLIASDRDLTNFTLEHEGRIYSKGVPETPPLTDELNPAELFAQR
jgi:spermidine synthase